MDKTFILFDLENCVLEKFGLSIEKTVFTSFYSSTENREIVLHFFVLSRKNVGRTNKTINK